MFSKNYKFYFLVVLVCFLGSSSNVSAQAIPKEELIFLTSSWKGEHFQDGRPRISDELIKRACEIGIEEAWQIVNNEVYLYQYERNWKIFHEKVIVVGRALTAQFMPIRPDVKKNIVDRAAKEGRAGRHLHWPINMLTQGDIEVQYALSTSQHSFMIEQDGNWIQGTHKGNHDTKNMVGTIAGNELRIRSTIPIVGKIIIYLFSGKVNGDIISGDIQMGEYLTAKFTARRNTTKLPKQKVMIPGGQPLAT